MTNEQLRMQMLAGIITESQYKEKMTEIEMGEKKPMSRDDKETLRQQNNAIKDTETLKRISNDIQQKKIFTSKTPGRTDGLVSIFVDENSQYKNLIGTKIERSPALGNTALTIQPSSKAETFPDEPTHASLGRIFNALYPERYITYSGASSSDTKAPQVNFYNSGFLVDASSPETKNFMKQNENVDDFGAIRELNKNTWWIDFRYRD